MDLKNTINNTNTQKDKLKKGKQNIDKKLMEHGGSKSMNISDVPNQIQKMVSKFSKVAFMEFSNKYISMYEKRINYNLDFTPKIAIFYVTAYDATEKNGIGIYNSIKPSFSTNNSILLPKYNKYVALKIAKITNTYLEFDINSSDDSCHLQKMILIG